MLSIENYYSTLPEIDRKEAAEQLHERILGDAQRVFYALCDLCEHLKTMRDARLYIDLGYETFETYVEEKAELKQRQAYTYISAYERLGKSVLQSNANLGITKLSLLAEVSGVDRADFMEENDLSGLSVKEIKELVKKSKDQGEQLGFLQEKLDKVEKEANDSDFLERELAEAENREAGLKKLAESRKEELDRIHQEMEDLQNRPVEVAVSEISEEEREKIRLAAIKESEKKFAAEKKQLSQNFKDKQQKAVEKATSTAKEDLEKAVKTAREEAEKAVSDRIAAEREQAEREKQELLKRAEQLERQMKNSSDVDIIEVNLLFTSWQEVYQKLTAKIETIEDPEKADKLRQVVRTVVAQFAQK